MTSIVLLLIGALVVFGALVVGSQIVEALRPSPARPAVLSWAPDIPVRYLDVGGIRVRYVKAGAGRTLVLFHTLRTQLDIFYEIIPELAEQFTVIAYDYPGHGWSDIPRAAYAPEDFYSWTAAFLDALGIEDAVAVGISIGGTISLVLAARQNPRIVKVVAVNPYDYWPAGGLRTSSPTARLVFIASDVPVLGATFMRLRTRIIMDRIFAGGLAWSGAMPAELARELYEVGSRPGHYQAFQSLLAHEELWSAAHGEYPRIRIPVLLVYGDRDWAPDEARDATRSLIPGVISQTVPNGSHFLSLDRSSELVKLIVDFARD